MMEYGAQSAVRDGAEKMQMQYVGNWGFPDQVDYNDELQLLHINMYVMIGATARLNGAFRQGSGPILLANVRCNGLEERLFDCPQSELEENNCGHNQDAGVVCLPGKIIYAHTEFLSSWHLILCHFFSSLLSRTSETCWRV